MRFCSLGLVFSLFIGLIIGGLILLLAVPLYIFPRILKSQLYIRQNSDGSFPIATSFWAKLPAIEHFRFYMFNITNPHEILKGAPVELEEKGPYTYIQTEFKQDIVFEDDGNLVRYKNNKTWIFSPEYSCSDCKESDRFYQVNVVYAYVASFASSSHLNREILHVLDLFLLFVGSHALSNLTVKDYLFGSYRDPVVEVYHNKIFQVIHNALGAPLPIPAIGYMGYLPRYNLTSDGEMLTKTGKRNTDEIGHIVSWRNQTELPWWKDGESRTFNGSGGAFSVPRLPTEHVAKTFQPLTCRVWNLSYMNKTAKVKDIETYLFGMHPDEYNTEKHPGYRYENVERADYFPHLNRTGESKHEIPNGIIPLRCLPALLVPLDFPAFFSPPHFYGSAKGVSDNPQVKGLNPNESLHQAAIFNIEPKSGATMHAIFRIQANFALTRNQIFHELKHVPNAIFPSFWLEVEAYVQDNCLHFIRFNVSILPALLFWAGIGCSLLGGVGTLFIVYCCWKKKKHPHLEWCLYEAK